MLWEGTAVTQISAEQCERAAAWDLILAVLRHRPAGPVAVARLLTEAGYEIDDARRLVRKPGFCDKCNQKALLSRLNNGPGKDPSWLCFECGIDAIAQAQETAALDPVDPVPPVDPVDPVHPVKSSGRSVLPGSPWGIPFRVGGRKSSGRSVLPGSPLCPGPGPAHGAPDS